MVFWEGTCAGNCSIKSVKGVAAAATEMTHYATLLDSVFMVVLFFSRKQNMKNNQVSLNGPVSVSKTDEEKSFMLSSRLYDPDS